VTEAFTPTKAECLHCGKQFRPRKFGHVFCSIGCRHRGERKPHERVPLDEASVERLFDESRHPGERVRPDDPFFGPEEAREVFAVDTVGTRRRWYLTLRATGRL
jgi:hypothetical protein